MWALLGRAGRLLHIGQDGTILQDITLNDRTRVYSLRLAADLERRQIWFMRATSAGRNELLRIELNGPNGQAMSPRTISDTIPGASHLAPDLSGGLWLVNQMTVTRMDASGRAMFAVQLDAP